MFWADDDGATGNELWAYETTNTTHWQVADINSGATGSIHDNSHTTTVGTRLYFAADDGVSGQELWAHESTNSTTWRVTDINSGAADSLESSNGWLYGMLTSVGTRLYFAADDGVSGMELWTHETTNSTTFIASRSITLKSQLI